MSGIFISYRRDDGAGWAGRMAADLRREFPANSVFHDIGSIALGEDFVEATQRSLAGCAVVIVVIGPRWLDMRDEAGLRRLDDPDDLVRLEIEESLRRSGLKVVPVLVGGAAMPKGAALPESVRPLARRHAHEITDRRWEFDFSQLVVALRQMLPSGHVPSAPLAPVAHTAMAPGTVFRDGDALPEMLVIPDGRFEMGSLPKEEGRFDDEGRRHTVTIAQAFALGKYAVTFDEWDAFAAATGAPQPDDESWGRGRRPVINVSWDDAQSYAAWLSKNTGKTYRLPSEAEWEYAARAGSQTRYPWGDAAGKNQANFDGSGSHWSNKQTAPVGSFAANRFGLHDMIGNVWEWAQDCWNESYGGAPDDGQAWEAGDCLRRVVRGGSWSSSPQVARVANRYWYGPAFRSSILGFRLARTL